MGFSLKNVAFGFGSGMIVMGLIFYCIFSSAYKAPADPALVSASDLPDDAITKRAEELGMSFQKGLTEEDITDAMIVEKARKLGMDFEYVFAGQDAPEIIDTDAAEENVAQAPTEFIEVTIPEGLYASDIAEILFKKGVVDDETAFSQFLSERRSTTKLRSGVYMLPINGDYEQVTQIVMHE